jgi:crotonobetainyl-CoA:carnitine CoA-transferase CaiB-like acyl-CoA transferase
METHSVKVLEGLKVIDAGSYISTPYAAMLLAELGADVIKVERPRATDPSRLHVVNGKTPVYSAINRNKRAIALDYTQPAGMAVFEKLVKNADMLLINVRPGVESKMGIDAERMQAINPRLIYCSVTGFGATGPYAKRPAYDNVGQAMSGWLSRFHRGTDPRVCGPTVTDSVTAMQACIGVLAALHDRARTGKGRKVEVNLMESMIAMATEPLTDFLFTGKDQPFYHRGAVSQAYILTCRDGKRIGLHLSTPDKFWHALTKSIDRPDVREKYPTGASRVANYADIATLLAGIFATRDRADWLPVLEANDVPFGPERTLDEVEQDPQIQHLGTFAAVDEAAYGTSRIPNRPARFDGDNRSVFSPAPRVGQHSDEVLGELGLDAAAIQELRSRNIVD